VRPPDQKKGEAEHEEEENRDLDHCGWSDSLLSFDGRVGGLRPLRV
jgi:hypothetical protein